ncbi:hypothetical protein PM025_06305 [Halorubrum ezzemoulense]|uniref:hypothetical protein n=1 Tax=Halorubrum ezzemoulense TaxID=337243 RepID=UPI00232F90D3|nr:hypothetical protein [Halorubrum ezzemoulense]MDB2263758.1 hypothetical protein [Halorubrum ezzemoulense]
MTLPYDVSGHTDCNAPLGLVVHGPQGSIRLPIVNDGLQLYERKMGPTAITRRAEATIPIEDSAGTVWTEYVSAFNPVGGGPDRVGGPTTSTGIPTGETGQSGVQMADVIGQPLGENGEPVGELSVLFRGYVGAVGSREGVNRARLQVYDPMKFLGQVEAGRAFTDATTTDVLNYITGEYQDAQRVFSEVSVSTDGTDARPLRAIALDDATLGDVIGLAISDETLQGQFTFSTNRDTLVDVVEWLSETANVRVWFQPSGERGISLVAVRDGSKRYDLTPSSDRIPFVISNNSLYELSPINGVKVKGATGKRIQAGPIDYNLPTGTTYTEATAVYPPLVERFGGELLHTTTSKETDGDALANEAAKKLKEAVDAKTDGEMITTLAPQLRPYDRVESTPACAGVTTDVPPLRYEVQEAVHSVVPSDNNLPRTEINVSMSIRPDEIETRTVVKDARGGEPSDDSPSENYEFDYQTAP